MNDNIKLMIVNKEIKVKKVKLIIDLLSTVIIPTIVFINVPFEKSVDVPLPEWTSTAIFTTIPFLLFSTITLLDFRKLKNLLKKRGELE